MVATKYATTFFHKAMGGGSGKAATCFLKKIINKYG